MLRLVKGSTTHANDCKPSNNPSTHSWTISQIATNLEKLNRLKPAHVGYIDRLIGYLIASAEHDARRPNANLPNVSEQRSRSGDALR